VNITTVMLIFVARYTAWLRNEQQNKTCRVNPPAVQRGASGKDGIIIYIELDALGVITISRGCFERGGSNKKTPP